MIDSQREERVCVERQRHNNNLTVIVISSSKCKLNLFKSQTIVVIHSFWHDERLTAHLKSDYVPIFFDFCRIL